VRAEAAHWFWLDPLGWRDSLARNERPGAFEVHVVDNADHAAHLARRTAPAESVNVKRVAARIS
jgi:hypothetical protein